MEKRKLGTLEIPKLIFGTNVFGWTIDEKTSFTLLDTLFDAGLNCLDTADVYSKWAEGNKGGESETIIGKWLHLKGNRDKMIVCTKVGMEMKENEKGLSEKYILNAVEASLKRLQTDYIDLYQAHKDDENTPIDETLNAFEKLVKQGKVRMIGASNFTAPRLKKSLEISKEKHIAAYKSLQPHYNLFARMAYETELEKFCTENNVGVIPYYSLASGFLTGKYRSEIDFSKSLRGSSIGKFLTPRGYKILAALDTVSEKHGANPTQISLAWLMARPGITAPIASATSRAQISDLVKATAVKLTNSDIADLNEASAY